MINENTPDRSITKFMVDSGSMKNQNLRNLNYSPLQLIKVRASPPFLQPSPYCVLLVPR